MAIEFSNTLDRYRKSETVGDVTSNIFNSDNDLKIFLVCSDEYFDFRQLLHDDSQFKWEIETLRTPYEMETKAKSDTIFIFQDLEVDQLGKSIEELLNRLDAMKTPNKGFEFVFIFKNFYLNIRNLPKLPTKYESITLQYADLTFTSGHLYTSAIKDDIGQILNGYFSKERTEPNAVNLFFNLLKDLNFNIRRLIDIIELTLISKPRNNISLEKLATHVSDLIVFYFEKISNEAKRHLLIQLPNFELEILNHCVKSADKVSDKDLRQQFKESMPTIKKALNKLDSYRYIRLSDSQNQPRKISFDDPVIEIIIKEIDREAITNMFFEHLNCYIVTKAQKKN